MNRLLFTTFIATLIVGCGEKSPPEINTKKASKAELQTYLDVNCQDKYRMHAFCVDASGELKSRNYIESLNKPGALGSTRSAEELFGKKK
ncbi:hypothetical protein LJR129_005126 [Acidovorax sp. LjRoot129]|uniref:hypothetical protein n=1 Tax=Acidovorax sp. LjRoot129 TaxID=3342260 RepID=UPI003ECC87C9